MRLGNNFPIANDHFALYARYGFYRVTRGLAVGLGGFLIDDHIRLDMRAHHIGSERYERCIVCFGQFARDAGNRVVFLAFGNV